MPRRGSSPRAPRRAPRDAAASSARASSPSPRPAHSRDTAGRPPGSAAQTASRRSRGRPASAPARARGRPRAAAPRSRRHPGERVERPDPRLGCLARGGPFCPKRSRACRLRGKYPSPLVARDRLPTRKSPRARAGGGLRGRCRVLPGDFGNGVLLLLCHKISKPLIILPFLARALGRDGQAKSIG